MTDVTIYKPPTVTIRLVAGQYVIIKPAGLTIQALNRAPPVDQTALVAALTAQVQTLTRELEECRNSHAPGSARRAGLNGWPVRKANRTDGN